MKTEKTINLTAYMVEYIDQREPKPRNVHTQTVVLDGGKISAQNQGSGKGAVFTFTLPLEENTDDQTQ